MPGRLVRWVLRIFGIAAALPLMLWSVLWLSLYAPALEVPPQEDLVLEDVTIINPGLDRREHQTIRIREGLIASIEDSVPREGAEPSELAGSYVLPGLIDMHVHLPPWWLPHQLDLFLRLFLEHGVTTVRDMGSIDGRIFEIKRQIEAGERAGPRIFACGPILDGDPPVLPFARVVRDAAEATRAAEEIADQGADCLKVYSHLGDEALDAIAAVARRRGIPVVGHLPVSSPWTETRISDIQHLCDPRCGIMNRRDAAALVRTAAEHGVAHTPTLSAFDRTSDRARRLRSGDRTLPWIWRLMDLALRRAEGDPSTWSGQARADRMDHLRTTAARLHAAGVALHSGSDTPYGSAVPGLSLLQELDELAAAAGLDAASVSSVSTRAARRSLSHDRLGLIAAGAPADLLLFADDPTDASSAGRLPDQVLAAGRRFEPSRAPSGG